MKIEDICKVQYLSCVEAYFGAWVKDKIPLGALYCESFLSWTAILKAFSSYETYANFSKIRRLQDFAEHIGLISHKMTDKLLSSDQFDVKTLTLFAVNDRFFLKRKAWREDHYIAINEYSEKNISYVNQYPLEEKKVRTSDIFRYLSGKCLLYFQTKKYNKELFSFYSDLQRERMKNFDNEISCSPILDTVKLRDAVGVLRVSRKRTLEWLLWDSETFFDRRNDSLKIAIENELEVADRIYLQLQMGLIKSKNFASSFLNQIMEGLLNYDKKIFIEAGHND